MPAASPRICHLHSDMQGGERIDPEMPLHPHPPDFNKEVAGKTGKMMIIFLFFSSFPILPSPKKKRVKEKKGKISKLKRKCTFSPLSLLMVSAEQSKIKERKKLQLIKETTKDEANIREEHKSLAEMGTEPSTDHRGQNFQHPRAAGSKHRAVRTKSQPKPCPRVELNLRS